MQKFCIKCSCCCPDPAPQFTFERDESVRFGSTLPRPSAALGWLWYNSCIGDTGLLSQSCQSWWNRTYTASVQFRIQTKACPGCSLHFQTFLVISWFGFGEVLRIEIVLVHTESSSCSPDNLALSPSVGRSYCVFLKENTIEMRRKMSIFLFRCKEFDLGFLFPSFQHECLKIVIFLITTRDKTLSYCLQGVFRRLTIKSWPPASFYPLQDCFKSLLFEQ